MAERSSLKAKGAMRIVTDWRPLAPAHEVWAGLAGGEEGRGRLGCKLFTKSCDALQCAELPLDADSGFRGVATG